jgi:hypothetical protein
MVYRRASLKDTVRQLGTLHQEKENIDISGNFEHFVAQKVPKYSKNRSRQSLGVVKSV